MVWHLRLINFPLNLMPLVIKVLYISQLLFNSQTTSISILHHHHILSSMPHILLTLSQFKLEILLILLFNLVIHSHIYICSCDIMPYCDDNMP